MQAEGGANASDEFGGQIFASAELLIMAIGETSGRKEEEESGRVFVDDGEMDDSLCLQFHFR